MPPCSPADTRLGTVARDQRSLGASVMLFQSEVTTARPELDRERARLLFVGVEMEVSLPLARRDQPVGDVAQRHDRAQRAVGDAVLERRGHALLGHRIGAFDDCERGLHFPNAAYQRVNVNSPPAVGMSSATTRFANKKARPPVMPGSTPRMGRSSVMTTPPWARGVDRKECRVRRR